MDVQSILIGKVSKLPDGEHSEGLKAVLLHIESAVRHFRRGQQESDETYFTDAIYRCNQAFEGSIKEAYRVLASKNPDKITPAEIESFLASGDILRKRVLDQFTNYRREWRNPSTHDYKLDFDEDEALLAIVSVAVFAIVIRLTTSSLSYQPRQRRVPIHPSNCQLAAFWIRFLKSSNVSWNNISYHKTDRPRHRPPPGT
jgi:hypothetical protein